MKKFFTALVALLLTAGIAWAQPASYNLKTYASTNGGILTNLSPDGKWAVINLGTSASGMTCNSELFNTATGEHFTVTYRNLTLSFSAVSDEDAQGYVTIVGSYSNRPVAYRFRPAEPKTEGKFTIFTNKVNWASGALTGVTPDGKYAIGHFTNYTGQDVVGAELNGEFWFSPIYADLSEGKIIELEGLPKGDRNGGDQHALSFSGISEDGKKILGAREWFMPVEGFYFIYDVDKKDWTPIGFNKGSNGRLTSVSGVEYLDFPVMSPNGKYVGGLAIAYDEDPNNTTEIKAPFRYDVETGSLTIFKDAESGNMSVGCMDNAGTILGYADGGSPLRHFKIFYQDKFWIPFSQLCQQIYGFNFFEKTGFEFSGTATNISGDGRKFIAFSDPTDQSYVMDFGCTVEEACAGFDLLSNYTVEPEAGATISRLSKVEINFGRAVQILGKGNTHVHLYKVGKNGNADSKICDGVSSETGIQLKTGSSTSVIFSIQSRYGKLEDGEDYYFLIDEGAIGVATDASKKNKAIRIKYRGRNDGPVKIVKVVPEDGSELKVLDPSAAYIQFTFDCPVKLANGFDAYIERAEDGVRVSTLSIATGNTDATKNQILVYPTSTLYLYQDVDYRVVLDTASVTDYSGAESSYNSKYVLNYKGTYVREVKGESTLFYDSFNDPNSSLGLWLNYEGDHNTPLVEQKEWGFDADNTPWNFSTHDSSDDPDYYATSHSLYAPSGTSNDWMMTPQLQIPEDGKVVLTFDAQKMKENKDDHLWLYIYEDSRVISYLNDNNMKIIQENVELLDEITDLKPTNGAQVKDGWKSYQYSLDKYAGKDIYIAFVNKNTNQSCVFVDNVSVEREILYTIGFSNEDRVVAKDEIQIKGTFTIKTKEFAKGAITLTLKDAAGEKVSEISWPSISGTSIVDRPIPMTFSNALPLVVGEENPFTIDVAFNGEDAQGEPFVKKDVYSGKISNLAFLPTKRVVLEEMTGITCPNCPQGHISIEHCEKQYKDQFIPISIHSYDGDDLGAQFYPYSAALGLNGAPSARINRIPGTYYPMYGTGSDVLYDMKEQNLWYNIVAQELDKPALCDISINAMMDKDENFFTYSTKVKFAVNEKKQVSLFFVVMEDGIVSYQENNFSNSEIKNLGEWGLGGIYGSYYAYPVTHNDVVRGVIGETFSGTLGMFPGEFKAGQEYTTDQYEYNISSGFADKKKIKIAALLVDIENGEIINAAVTKVAPYSVTGVDVLESETVGDTQQATEYTLDGRVAHKSYKGIVVKGGKKVLK